MADYRAISDVGQTLVGALTDQMSLVGEDDVALTPPHNVGKGEADYRLTCYLYDVTESGHLKNAEPPPKPGEDTPSAITLDLYYLLTAHPSGSGPDDTAITVEQHNVLGEAMQVLAEDGILEGTTLHGTLSGDPPLQVTIAPDQHDHVTNVWGTFSDTPFRPSVSYLVTPVVIEATDTETDQRVLERRLEERTRTGDSGAASDLETPGEGGESP